MDITLKELENHLTEIFKSRLPEKTDSGIIKIYETDDTFTVKLEYLVTGIGGLKLYLSRKPVITKIEWTRPTGFYVSETTEEIEKTIQTILTNY